MVADFTLSLCEGSRSASQPGGPDSQYKWEITTGQCSDQQQKVQRDKGRTNKDQDTCPDDMTGGDDRGSLGSRAGLDHDPQENCTEAAPQEGDLQKSLRYPTQA